MSGTLSKKHKRHRKYSRYWFVLRHESLSYYTSATETYFPAGTIDLRYAIRAELSGNGGNSDSDQQSTGFSLLTEQRTYYFRSDGVSSAKYWVNSLQREIFRSKNEGDTVKIVIPIENIIDLEESAIFDVAKTLNIRAIDNEETYSIDEYVLAFFEQGVDAKNAILKRMKELGISSDEEDLDEKLMVNSFRVISERIQDSTSPPPSGAVTPTESKSLSLPSPASIPGKLRSLTIGPVNRSRSHGRALAEKFRHRVQTISLGELGHDSMEIFRSSNFTRERSKTGDLPPPPDESVASLSLGSSYASSVEGGPEEPERKPESLLSFDSKKLKNIYPFSVVSKVSEMWEGNTKHFKEVEDIDVLLHDDKSMVSAEERVTSNERFRAHFSLSEADSLVATYYCHLQKAFPIYGKIYLSNNHLCFRTLIPGARTKMILPLIDIENVTKEKGFRFGYSGLVVIIHGHEEIFFEFGLASNRDDCEVMVLREIDNAKKQLEMSPISYSKTLENSFNMAQARLCNYEDAFCEGGVTSAGVTSGIPPLIVEDASLGDIRDKIVKRISKISKTNLRFTMLTIGSRGDVQPYIALGKGLIKEGHSVKIATHLEFKEWIESHGIEFAEIAGDPGELMKIMVEHGMFSVSFLREASARFREWIDELLHTSWVACQDTDVLIESPSAMAGIHIAEALEIPYFRAFTMPWTRTRAYPHAFIVPEQKMGGSYNYLTYVLFDNVFWKGISSQVNRWRKEELGLERTNLDQLQQTKVPFLYSVSSAIFVPPVDFSDWIKVTGYWFLDEGQSSTYEPAEDLVAFIKKARDDGCKLVYIGFGSIVVSDPKELTKAVVNSVLKAKVRCILSKGWSHRLGGPEAHVTEIPLPPEVFQVKHAPHDWLFPQMDAAVHHGGSGTTGASLRAGLPTIIKPFFGDQFFYAGRVEDLGAGIHLKKLTVSQFSKALWEITHSERIINRATQIGRIIRKEDGISIAIRSLYNDMAYAKSLVSLRRNNNVGPNKSKRNDDDSINNSDESWTLVGDE